MKKADKTVVPNPLAFGALFIILAFTFVTRIDAIKIDRHSSFDEVLYNYLGTQFKHEPLNYSSSGFFKMVGDRIHPDAERERVRRYVDVPLFKHPPLFSYFIAISKSIFGEEGTRAGNYVSLFFAIGTVFVVYLLCKNLWGEGWGLLAALFMSIEPVFWLCSQKIWIETTLVFFVYLGLLLLFLGQGNRQFIILSGISFGLALLCKYPAILAIAPIFTILLVTNVIEDRKMLAVFILLPFMIGLPWFLWNWNVYGKDIFTEIIKINSSSDIGTVGFNFISKYVIIALFFAGAVAVFFAARLFLNNMSKKILGELCNLLNGPIARNIIFIFAVASIGTLFFMSRANIFKSFSWRWLAMPVSIMGAFDGHPHYFYFYHFVKLSPISIFSYLSIVFIKKWNVWIFIFASIVISLFSFFGFFGNYESRYVLIATPALMILSAYFIKEFVEFFGRRSEAVKFISLFLIGTAVIYAVCKTVYFDLSIVVKNDFFFF